MTILQIAKKMEKGKKVFGLALLLLDLFVCRSWSHTLASLWVSRQISRLIARAVLKQGYALQKQCHCKKNKEEENERQCESERIQARNICTNES